LWAKSTGLCFCSNLVTKKFEKCLPMQKNMIKFSFSKENYVNFVIISYIQTKINYTYLTSNLTQEYVKINVKTEIINVKSSLYFSKSYTHTSIYLYIYIYMVLKVTMIRLYIISV